MALRVAVNLGRCAARGKIHIVLVDFRIIVRDASDGHDVSGACTERGQKRTDHIVGRRKIDLKYIIQPTLTLMARNLVRTRVVNKDVKRQGSQRFGRGADSGHILEIEADTAHADTVTGNERIAQGLGARGVAVEKNQRSTERGKMPHKLAAESSRVSRDRHCLSRQGDGMGLQIGLRGHRRFPLIFSFIIIIPHLPFYVNS